MVAFCKLEQYLNAYAPMDVILSGIVTERKFEQCEST